MNSFKSVTAAMLFAAAGMPAAAQVTATYTGPNDGSYFLSTNWDINTVPINNGTTYDVIIPSDLSIDVGAAADFSIDSLNLQDDAEFYLGADTAITLLGPSIITGGIFANGADSAFTSTSTLDDIDNSWAYAQNGAVIIHTATTYETTGLGNGYYFRADDDGSTLALSSITTMSADPNDGGLADRFGIEAYGGGMIDLSSLTTFNGPTSDLDSDYANFWSYDDDSFIDLTGLQTITGPSDWIAFNGGTITMNATSLSGIQSILVGHDGVLNMPNLDSLNNIYLEVRGTYTLNTAPLTDIDDASIYVQDGGVFTTIVSSYSTAGRGLGWYFRADDAGSLLDMTSVTTMSADPDDGGLADRFGIEVYNGGTIDLSNLLTFNGPTSDLDSDYANFYAYDTDSFIDLSSLQTITGPSRWIALDGGTITMSAPNPPSIQEITIGHSGTINMPGLNSLNGIYLEIRGTHNFNTAPITNIDDAAIYVQEGGTYIAPTTSYSTAGAGNGWYLRADDAASFLDLTNITTMSADPDDGSLSDRFGIEAYSGGTIDLSNLTTFTGPTSDIDSDFANFWAHDANSLIDLSGLQSITGPSRWNALNGGTITMNAPNPPSIQEIIISHGGTINMPGLSDLNEIYLEVRGSYSLNTAPLTSIDDAAIWAREGATFTSTVSSYTTIGGGNGFYLRADDVGSSLDLSSITTMTADPNVGGLGERFGIEAYNSATIDLTGLTTFQGPTTDTDSDFANFWAIGSGSSIDLSNCTSHTGPAEWRVENGATIRNGSHCIATPNTQMSVTNGSLLEVGGACIFDGDSLGKVNFLDGTIHFKGDGIQGFEVAAEDLGVGGGDFNTNLVLGRMIIGEPGSPTTVSLCDGFDNGFRGPSSEPEALYLGRSDNSDGLIINAGSRLLIADLNVYVLISGTWTHIDDLLGASECVAFGDGEICRSTCRGDYNNDNRVDTSDFIAYLNDWAAGNIGADYTCDLIINTSDFIAFLNAWNAGC